jgi:hypothetical protein
VDVCPREFVFSRHVCHRDRHHLAFQDRRPRRSGAQRAGGQPGQLARPLALAVTRKEATIPVVYVELDEDEERLVLASLDPIASLAATDTAALAALAANFEVTDVATEQPELTEMVREMSGTKSQSTDSQSPSQDQIDARADEIEHAFEDRHLKSYEATCPNCGNGFSFAR